MQPPRRINYRRNSRTLMLEFADATFELPAELLRVYSPSAEVRGHGDGDRKLQTGKKYVAITSIEAVGNYAIRITFDDGHDTGLYGWDFLHDLGRRETEYWTDYEREMKAANASRLPTIAVGKWTPKL
ncbi:MAG: DUF971 domain-containing protein [Pseudomonadales bacterium]|nr:DUF971 domain-containing protein [Pseudomonadales bacterium]